MAEKGFIYHCSWRVRSPAFIPSFRKFAIVQSKRKKNGLYNPRLKKPELNPNTLKRKNCLELPATRLTSKSIKSTSLALESIDYIERSDGLSLGVLGIGNGIPDDTFQEGLENTAGLFVDHYRRSVRWIRPGVDRCRRTY